MVTEQELVRDFILSDKSPEGKWFIEVPVGIKTETDTLKETNQKRIDAVCFTSMGMEYPEEYPEYTSHVRYFDNAGQSNVSKVELYRRFLNELSFDSERAKIFEFKTSNASLFKGVGQLTVYEQLFKQDWGAEVEEKVLVSLSSDPLIEWGTKEAGIRVIHKSNHRDPHSK